MTNETTPDAVEQAIASLVNVLVNECSHTSETASALDVCLANLRHARHAERARHAEEVARLRDVHLDETRALDDLRLKEIASLRDQLREVTEERENRVAEMRAWGEVKLAGAQHEIAHLRAQLRKVEGERDVSRRQCGELHEHLALMVRYLEEETSAGDGIAEQHWDGYQGAKSVLVRTAANETSWETAMVEFAELQERASRVPGLSAALDEARCELAARRALDADARACAERCRDTLIGPPGMPVEDYPLAPVALAARRILAALDSQGGEGE